MSMSDPLVVISADGHAFAIMSDYRPYIDPSWRQEFDEFLVEWESRGTHNFDPAALRQRIDPKDVDEWEALMFSSGRVNAFADPQKRLAEAAREGVAAEVLFPDFGLPFELYSPLVRVALGHPPLEHGRRVESYRAFNRWLSDFVSVAPARFAGMGIVSWDEVDAAVLDIAQLARGGLKGVVLPEFSRRRPLFHPDFEPIWNAIEEHGLVVGAHIAISATSDEPLYFPGLPHPGLASGVFVPEIFFACHNLLTHLIWGGVLERHPALKVAITETGSAWTVPALAEMDHAYERGYNRSDFKDVLPHRPSEYFQRQCFIGSSIFSRAEIEGRYTIGIDRMMLGMDFPHHKGTLVHTTREYSVPRLARPEFPKTRPGCSSGRTRPGHSASISTSLWSRLPRSV